MLSVLGIALAIACVTVVRTISASFAITGADSVTDVLGGAQLWAVPAAGVKYDADAQALVANGPAPAFAAPEGWTVTRTLSGLTEINGHTVSLRGNDEMPSSQAVLGDPLAERLSLKPGDRVVVGGQSLVVDVSGNGQSITVASSPPLVGAQRHQDSLELVALRSGQAGHQPALGRLDPGVRLLEQLLAFARQRRG